ncbi:MAG TPA: hypothetical protein VJN88_06435, partial [Ktedonobacterales bacterium]|nr:hypothetical protein [Ktedonobacterales bacterium]
MSGFHPRRDWLLIPATLVMLTLLAFLVAHFFYDHGSAVVYWLILLYDYTFFDFRILAGILIVTFLLLLAGWRSADLFSGSLKRPLVATTLSLATFAMFLAAIAAIVTQRGRFASTPAGGAISAHGHIYRLAYRPTDGSYYTFVLFECDGSGIFCHPREESCVATATEPNLHGAPRGRLVLDPAT